MMDFVVERREREAECEAMRASERVKAKWPILPFWRGEERRGGSLIGCPHRRGSQNSMHMGQSQLILTMTQGWVLE